jgi:hypothetical protein
MIIGKSSGVSPDRERDREQEGFEDRPGKRQIHQEHEQREENCKPQDHEPEAMNAALERSRRLARAKCRCNSAEASRLAGCDHQHDRFAADDRSPSKQRIECFRRRGRIAGTGILVGRIGLPGHQGFIGVGIAAFQHDPIGRNEVSRSELDHVARHQLIDRYGGDDVIAANVGMHRDGPFQCLGGAFGPMLLKQIEPDRENDHRDNDAKAAEIPGRSRDGRGDEQDCDQRLGKSPGNLADNIEPWRLGDGVGTVASQPVLGLHPRQSRWTC